MPHSYDLDLEDYSEAPQQVRLKDTGIHMTITVS
jgi:hypothetical protein